MVAPAEWEAEAEDPATAAAAAEKDLDRAQAGDQAPYFVSMLYVSSSLSL